MMVVARASTRTVARASVVRSASATRSSTAFAHELGRPVRPAGVPWGADMRHFTALAIPCTMAGTGGIELAHAVDERIPVADLTALARATVRVLARATAFI